MSADQIEQARRHVEWSRSRLNTTLAALQERLRPGNLASNAWEGVREKSGDLADGALGAVRRRPAAVSAALGAFALFLAREPLKRAVGRLFSDEDEENGLVTTRIDTEEVNYNAAAPFVDAATEKE